MQLFSVLLDKSKIHTAGQVLGFLLFTALEPLQHQEWSN